MLDKPLLLMPVEWPAPKNVKAIVSMRQGGLSLPPYNELNLALHVGDDPAAVMRNRGLLAQQTGIKSWQWLDQVHGVNIVKTQAENATMTYVADGAYTQAHNVSCAVLTADCLPVLLCDKDGAEVAAVHAGWRGLAAGVLSHAVQKFSANPQDIMAYLGPAISAQAFEVGADVLRAFSGQFGERVTRYFKPAEDKSGYYFADLYGLARVALNDSGITQILGGDFCTYTDAQRFYSYRRDGVTGRMVSAVWIES